MKRRHTRVRRSLLFVPLCIACGCVEQTTIAPGETVFQFERWVPLTALAGAVLIVPLAWRLRIYLKKISFIALGLAPVAAIVIVPGLWRDRVTITDDRFTLETGLWFSPSHWDVQFDDVRLIRHVVSYIDRVRGLQQKKYKLVLTLKDGRTRTVPSGDLMSRAVPVVLARAAERGIEVRDESVLP